MAVVYLAHDLRHNRQVALKVLRQEVAQTVGSERFLREIQLAAQLTRPHILPLFDSGEVAGALDFAHRQGIVHRDIKPQNILLHDGHALVADFGIGKALSAVEGESLTQTGMSVGTPAYMSPEQAVGESVDGRSDLYSLGCVLYEMLVGEPPFTATRDVSRSCRGPRPRLTVAMPPRRYFGVQFTMA